MISFGKFFLQIVYDCNPQDKKNLEELQVKIQERINFLTEQNLDSYNDSTLLEYYGIYGKIQECIFEDHTDQYLTIAAIVAALSIIIIFRWKMISRKN